MPRQHLILLVNDLSEYFIYRSSCGSGVLVLVPAQVDVRGVVRGRSIRVTPLKHIGIPSCG